MGNNNEGKNVAVLNEVGRQAYEGSVMYRMQGRSGAHTPKGASGIALEIMANDKANVKNLTNPGAVTKLTKCPTATQVDAVTMKNGKVLERIQYKDTPSASGIQKTLKQVESGKYQQTQLRGTVETAEKFNALAESKGMTKRMQSTGISSDTTNRIGGKVTGTVSNMKNVSNLAKSSAGSAAVLTAGVEVVKSVVNGDSVGECTSHVVSKSAESAVATAASVVAGEGAATAASLLLAATPAAPLVPVIAVATSIATGMGASQITDGVFNDIGESVGNAVERVTDGIGNMFSDIGSGISSFFGGIFG